MYTLNATGVHGVMQPIPFDTTQITSKANGSKPQAGDPCHPLAAGAHAPAIAQPIAFEPGKMKRLGHGDAKDGLTPTLRANAGDNQLAVAVAQPIVLMDQGGSVMNVEYDISGTLRRETHGHEPTVVQPPAMQVRRLTPVECERLQGFPDNYTDIKLKGKPTPDGPRYKALGNSMAVPVMAWIGKRIQEVETLLPQALESTSPKKNP
jgi:DNA (cytosine-5)-methyltransferase 1